MFRHILLYLLFLTLNIQLEGKSSFDYSNYKATYTNTKLLMTKVPCTKGGESSVYITRSGVTFTMVDVFKRGDYTGRMENTEFYGVNSAVLVQGGQLKMSLGSITSLAKGANAIVATNNGIASLSGTNIKTTGDLSRGFQATYGGEIFGSSLSISTEGKSSAALATDKGEGKVSCSSCTLSTKDVGSPLIYSTGNIQITSTKGTASKAQAIVIEGKNNVKITSSTLKCGGISYNNKNDECGVLIYQSMSGDSNEGISTFTSTSSTIEILSTSPSYSIAPMFYITNTETNIKLTSSTLNFGSNIFMKIDEGTWGISGNNGGKAIVTLTCTDVKGNIIVGHTSTLTLYLFGTNFIGTINGENTAQKIEIFVDKNSTITITGNSYVTHLTSQLKNGANLINGTYTWNDGHNIPPSSIPVPWEDDPVSQIPEFLKKLIDDALATLGVEAARNICRKYINEEICKAYLG